MNICAQTGRKVTVIPPIAEMQGESRIDMRPKRVAAYCRVSTDREEQEHSFETQKAMYTEMIMMKPSWQTAGIYADEGITGTVAKKRPGFMKMIEDCRKGKIDMIVTKSVSRFSRNNLDCLMYVRELKQLGIPIIFEKEGINTIQVSSELLLTLFGALSQAESESISMNVKLGIRQSLKNGNVRFSYKTFLGYRKGADGQPEIVPEQADIVRRIYNDFLAGATYLEIAKRLTEEKVPTMGGGSRWFSERIKSILKNEKYKGDALLQKTFCTDFLTKAYKVNEGEVPQYYVEHSHPAIIDRAMFDAVQTEIKRRAEPGQRTYTPYTLSGKIYCAECGARYGSKMRRGKQSWRCNNRHLGRTNCTAPVLHTETIEDAFVTAFNQVIERKDEIIRICMDTMTERCDVSGIDARLATLSAELDVVAELIAQNIATNARVALDQDENRQKFEELMARHDSIQNEIHELERQRAELIAKLNGIRHYIGVIQDEGRITGFDETLWLNTVDRLWIKPDGTMRFEFKGGPAIEG